MLSLLQKWSGTRIFKVVLALIGFSFLLLGWQMGNGFSNPFASSLAKVNGESITVQSMRSQVEQRIRTIRHQLGANYSPAILKDLHLVDRMLDDTIRNTLLRQYATENGITIPDGELAGIIAQNKAFQGIDGQFDAMTYRNVLANAGLTTNQYEDMVREELMTAQVRDPFGLTAFLNKPAIHRAADYLKQTRDVKILTVSQADITPPKAPTEDDLKNLYDEMATSLMTPEYRTLEVVTYSKDTLADSYTPTEDDIKADYETNSDSLGEPESRDVSHILVHTQEEATQLAKQLSEGANFAEQAKAHSIDKLTATKGGELGVIKRGEMLKPFEDAAFALADGATSEPVKTAFGYHLIKVNKINPSHIPPLADVRSKIIARLKQEHATDALYDVVEKADNRLSGGDPLKEVAESTHGTYQVYTKVAADGTTADGLDVNAPHFDQILKTAFTLDADTASAPIQLDDNTQAFVKVTSIEAPRQRTINEVRKELEATYTSTMVENALRAKATQILASLNSNTAMEEAARNNHLKNPIQTVVGMERVGPTHSPLINAGIRNELFKLHQGEYLSRAVVGQQGASLFQVTNITQPSVSTSELDKISDLVSNTFRNDVQSQFLTALRQTGSIKVNESRLQTLRDAVLQ